ncbi:MAG: hydroxylamine reductase [Deltaproteobacteria bacterium]|nr:hydroxylamine reductase [Deltaproteobacteria bacterium]
MFCNQCEQTAGGRGCTESGVCGKSAKTSGLQDGLTGSLLAAARNQASLPEKLLLKSLFATLTNVNFDDDSLERLTGLVNQPSLSLTEALSGDEDVRSLKTLLLLGVRGVAAYAYHALILGAEVTEITVFINRALTVIGRNDATTDDLLPAVMECGRANYSAMELLDEANTKAFGHPEPTAVSRTIEPKPFIVVSGHDLLDLKLLLMQTEGTGVNIYTHGEMLPAQAYPELKKFSHLKGHFGTAWPNQQKELANVPGAVLFTTNCLMPPKPEYIDRVFTTGAAGYPGMVHIGRDKNFGPVIKKALDLSGYQEPRTGGTFLTGFGHEAVLKAAGTIIEAVRSGAIRHFFLVGGCDGTRGSRSYFTEFVKMTPKDTVILTLGCGKFRFNGLDLGQIGPLPRIIDMGQCNDAYSAIKVASALAEALNCEVNELPLSLVISWYEQKAVSILLTLLYLKLNNILLGPTLPAFISPGVLNYLVTNFNIGPISSPADDLKRITG